MYNVMDALCGCRAVDFDSCNNVWSSVHTIIIIVIILRPRLLGYQVATRFLRFFSGQAGYLFASIASAERKKQGMLLLVRNA